MTDVNSIEFIDLQEAPQHVSKIAEWWQDEWGYISPQRTIRDRLNEAQGFVDGRPNGFERAIIAVDDEMLIGTATLIKDDMSKIEHDLSPWLASVYVKPDSRRVGIGRRLVETIEEIGSELGYDTLYLYTPDKANWYASFGWIFVQETIYSNTNVTIMKKSIQR